MSQICPLVALVGLWLVSSGSWCLAEAATRGEIAAYGLPPLSKSFWAAVKLASVRQHGSRHGTAMPTVIKPLDLRSIQRERSMFGFGIGKRVYRQPKTPEVHGPSNEDNSLIDTEPRLIDYTNPEATTSVTPRQFNVFERDSPLIRFLKF
ncbi:hypothetical protein BV898_08973 [Hypsibius exemplaris]|uniref:Uncharacterized protein n=1 Tax=Hypsibius exemplaris TaxID=2072580 RepID=A0A1W0WP35_HYPEX|nr:hypothetical protein BV898_08973 [Hypsibius exemplaris]